MSGENKCKWCGAATEARDGMSFASCGTWAVPCNNVVHRGARCERDELRQRIDAAINRAERAMQFGILLGTGVACAFTADVADVVSILRGNSPTNLEGSDG